MNEFEKIILENCKNIKNGEITIYKDILNVKYADNGTGKSTIAEAIKYYAENDMQKMNSLKSYGATSDPKITFLNQDREKINTKLSRVEVYNEDFVNNIVFNKNEAIKDSFNVFIKTPEYDLKRKELDKNLSGLKIDLREDSTINKMTQVFNNIISKISFNNNGTLAKRGMGKAVSNKTNVYQLPEELEKFKDFFQDDQRVNWVDWKSRGQEFDEKSNCPFCAKTIDRGNYEIDKEIFESTYDKNTIKNQKDLEDYLITLKPFMNTDDYDRIFKFTREIINEQDFNAELKRFYDEVDLVNRKISEAIEFDSNKIASQDLDSLDKIIRSLLIDKGLIKIFNSLEAKNVYDLINGKIKVLLEKVEILKKEFKELNVHIDNAINESKDDINSFLKSAGINYEFDIVTLSEVETKTELRYCGNSGKTFDVAKVRESLSWGERNSISLILFMYYALQKEVDLIVLDDPISSFDKNKKYAIMNRLFPIDNNGIKSFHKKTVLFLTHDFEPVIDLKHMYLCVNGLACGYFISNIDGVMTEFKICTRTDIRPITVMYLEDANNPNLLMTNRVASLRKYLEYLDEDYLNNNMAYNILSSLMKGRKREKVNVGSKRSNIMTDEQYDEGITEINKYIDNFNYEELLEVEFKQCNLINQYFNEDNSYLKIQIFRQIYNLDKKKKNKLRQEDKVLKKFADESYHIENDYTHCLDYVKFDIVPNYIMKRVENYMNQLRVLEIT